MPYSSEFLELEKMFHSEHFDIHIFEDKFSEYISKHKNEIPGEAFKLFKNYDGDDEHQRAMWTMLHAIESLELEEYIRQIITALKYIADRGSEWAELIVVRNLNSSEHRTKLSLALKTASNKDKIIWKKTVQELVLKHPEFKNKAFSILEVLN